MNTIQDIRNKWNALYQPMFLKIVGVLLVWLGSNYIVPFGPFGSSIEMIIPIAITVVYFFNPGFAMFAFACTFFICTVHINGIFALLAAFFSMFLCTSNYMYTALAVFTPIAMSFSGIIEPFYWGIFIMFIFFAAKREENPSAIFYSLYFSSLMQLFGKFGTYQLDYVKYTELSKTYATNLNSFLSTIHITDDIVQLLNNDIVSFIIVVGICIAAAQIMYLLFANKKLFAGLYCDDIKDLIMFIITAGILVVTSFAFEKIAGVDCETGYITLALQAILAYILSRPFACQAALQSCAVAANLDNDENSVNAVQAQMPKEGWDSIAGYENTKREIQATILPYVSREEYRKMQNAHINPVKGILLFGPPGTGKTTIARAIAHETKMKLFVVNAGEFFNKYVGESEKNLRNIFAQAKASAPSLICFDEIESFLSVRNSDSKSYEKNVITTFLSQMDGFNELKNVLIVATTNQPALIDPAALRPGRFDKIIYVGPPDEAGRKALFRKYLHKRANFDYIDFDRLVEHSERFTGADIKGVCEEAYRKNGYAQLTEEQIVNQIDSTRPSFTLDMRDEYYKWSRKYNRNAVPEEEQKKAVKKRLTWDDIKGMDELKEVLKNKIEVPFKNIDKYRQYNIPMSKGILFFGPPGCGKTFFAKVLSDECNTTFFTINGPELLSSNTGESEANLRKVFRAAREAKPAIIFFDEIDAIAESRDTAPGKVKLINQLLTEMDGMESLDGVVVIAATNRPDAIDTALLRAGRFDTKIYIGMPDTTAIKEMLISSLADIPNTLDYALCAEKLVGYSSADVSGVTNKTKEFFVQRSIMKGDETPVSNSDFDTIISTTKASLSEAELKKYEAMKSLQSIM